MEYIILGVIIVVFGIIIFLREKTYRENFEYLDKKRYEEVKLLEEKYEKQIESLEKSKTEQIKSLEDKYFKKMASSEKRYFDHIKTLEEKLVKTNPELYWRETNEGRRPIPNQMAKETVDEVPLADIPMMEFGDRDFNIQLEGDSETPAEARARKEK